MRILVVGGGGFFGQGVVRGLEAAGGEVYVGSRRAGGERGVRVDITEPSREILTGWDAVVNCSDDAVAPPDAAIAAVLGEGGTWVETTADPRTLARLQARFEGQTGEGRLVLGVGIFPGVSGLLMAALKTRRPELQRIDFAVRVSQLSASGEGTAALMARALEHPAVFLVDGRRCEEPPVRLGPSFPFVSGERPSVWAGLPEPLLLGKSLGLREIRTAVSPKPGVLRWSFWVLGRLPVPRLLRPLYSWVNRTTLVVLRTVLMKGRSTGVEMTARGGDGSWISLSVSDGMAAGGWLVAAMTRLICERSPAPGLWGPEGVLTLEDVLEEFGRLAGDEGRVARAAGGGAAWGGDAP